MRSMLRMLLPSASALTIIVCFSVERMFAIQFLILIYCATVITFRQLLFVLQEIKGKKGRPKLPVESAKSSIVRARVSAEELSRIEKAAQSEGVKTSDWVRKTLLSAAT